MKMPVAITSKGQLLHQKIRKRLKMKSPSSQPFYAPDNLLTRVLPGVIAVLPIFLYWILIPGFPTGLNSSTSVIAFLLIAFAFGEGTNIIRRRVVPVPGPFRRLLFSETGSRDYLKKREWRLIRWEYKLCKLSPKLAGFLFGRPLVAAFAFNATEGGFLEELEEHLGISVEKHGIYTFYELFFIYIEPKLSPRTRFQQVAYLVYQNSIIGSVIAFAIIVLAVISSLAIGEPGILAVWLIVGYILLPFALYSIMLFDGTARDFVIGLVNEYYIDREIMDGGKEDTTPSVEKSLLNQ